MLPLSGGASAGRSDYGGEIPSENTGPRGLGAAGAQDPGGTLFGFSGPGLLTVGIGLVIFGLIFFAAGASYAMSAPPMPALTGNPQQDAQAGSDWMAASQAHALGGFILAAIGAAFLSLGSWAVKFGLVRPVSSYVAAEATPAITVAAAAIGEGLAQARGAGAGTGPREVETVVRVKCRNCGYLDSDDATYCSKCGKPL